MKLCRFVSDRHEGPRLGVVLDSGIHDVTPIVDELPASRWPCPPGDLLIRHLPQLRSAIVDLADRSDALAFDSVSLICPVANPGKFICGAGNHKIVLDAGGHPRRLGLLFKMTSAAAGPSDGIELRWPERTTFHEAEIAIIISEDCTNVPAEEALNYVAGYCIGLDMTMQGPEFPSFGKSFDTYGMMGPWLTTADEIDDPDDLSYRLTVNDELRTADTTANLVLGVADLVEHAASVMTLHPGDVIFAGTPPASVGPVVPGDTIHVEMDGLGSFTTEVRAGIGRQTPMDGMGDV